MKCVVCGKSKGRRSCKLHGGSDVCPLCCAMLRTADECDECEYFRQAGKHRKGRLRQGPRAELFMRIDERVEDETDRALQKIQDGYDVEEAKACIRRLHRENPDLACTQYAMGAVHRADDDLAQAVACFAEASTTDPYFAEAYFNLYSCFMANLQPLEGIRFLRAARDVAVSGGEVHRRASARLLELSRAIGESEGVDLETYLEAGESFERGVECMDKGDPRQAIIEFQQCARLTPKSAKPYGNLGMCYGKLGMKERALAMLDRALEIDPTYEPAKWNRLAVEEGEEPGREMGCVSFDYSAARHLEERERAGEEDRITGGLASELLNRLRAQGRG